jgi:PhzF family phenazine biosynthesis protein
MHTTPDQSSLPAAQTAEVLRYAAFTEDGRGGNAAGVVLDASDLTDAQMLAIAEDVGYSETAFVFPGDGNERTGLRFFSPRAEVAFCGHATIATAVALATRNGPGELAFTTPAGALDVVTVLEDGQLTATLTSTPTHTRAADPTLVARALAALDWSEQDLDPAYPAHVANAGNDHLLMAARDANRLADLDYDFEALDELMAAQGWTTVCLFRRVGPAELEVRNPFPPGGVVEDPATGAAAAALGGYLRDLGLVATPSRLVLHQGHHMGAPSRLVVDLATDDPRVRVSGTASHLAVSPYDGSDLP